MNRWISALLAQFISPLWGRTGLVHATFAFSVLLGAGRGVVPASAQTARSFPAQAQRALLQVTQAPDILLNGKPARLAPGARIRASNDFLVLSGTLTGQTLVVNVLFESGGLVKEVWILSPEEAAQAPAKP